MNRYIGEFLGTFMLIFVGTGAVVVNDVSGGVLGHLGVALAFGLVVMTMIYAVGDVSGAHLNPAVSFGFSLSGRLPWREAVRFAASQTIGAVASSLVVKGMFPQHQTLGVTLPTVTIARAFLFEIILTFLLMFVIVHVSSGAKEKGLMAGVAVGATVALAALFGGPVTGASMNPARSLAPALVSRQFEHLWIYLTAPFAGAALAILSCRLLRDEGCCESDECE